MADSATLELVIHKMDLLDVKLDKFMTRTDTGVHVSDDRLREIEKQIAVIENTQKNICVDIKELQAKSNRNDIAVVVANAIVVAIASAANILSMPR